MSAEIVKSEEEWARQLTPEQYEVLRGKGTEPPFSGKYVYWKEDGTYRCAACGAELFSSKAKFDSGTGWPSFFEALDQSRVELRPDHSHFMERLEVVCRRCGSHLGHVFEDGPPPTGERYCINSVSLSFERSEPSESNADESARDQAAVDDKRSSGHKGRIV